jgi:acyl-CoA synthetase (AMP-forming)/AMP-acid ligase II
MSNSSNLYADKVFSEHPMVLWALDDNIDYISLMPENKRGVSSWSKSAGTVVEVDSGSSPFPNSATSSVTLANPESEFSVATFVSDDIINFTLMNQELKTFCQSRLSDYKVPESFTFLQTPLPRNANGKLMKRLMRDELMAHGVKTQRA